MSAMSLRRPKKKITPIVSTRAAAQPSQSTIAAAVVADKLTTDADIPKTVADSPPIKSVSFEDQTVNTTADTLAAPPVKTRMTTKITAVLADEDDNTTKTDQPVATTTDTNNNNNTIVAQTKDTNDGHNRSSKWIPINNEVVTQKTDDSKQVVKESADDCETVDDKPKESTKSSAKTSVQKTETKTTTKESTTSRKRRMTRKVLAQKTDKTSMRMKDLLLYNPPMTDEQKEMRDKDTELTDKTTITADASDVSDGVSKQADEETTISESSTGPKSATAGPRVKVGADGQLILDEESVIVKRKKLNGKDEPTVIERAGAVSAFTNYSSFRSKSKTSAKPRWTEHETIRFFSALNTIGTDFTLMADLFFRGKRSRLDLRNKFKKEEKVNKEMIDRALFSPNTFLTNCQQLDEILDSDDTDSDDEAIAETVKENAVTIETT